MRRRAIVALLAPAVAGVLAPSAEARPGCHTRRCFRHAAELCKRDPACRDRVARRLVARASDVSGSDRAWLARVRACESGGDYSTNTGNGFYGAYQFTMSSWAAVGGQGRPDLASPAEQDRRALRLRAVQGVGAWPVCG